MAFGDREGAMGWLIGGPHHGLACMFTMMNEARLSTGLQGVAIAERAFQQALAYSKMRRQGRDSAGRLMAIAEHPDVRRMLLTMRALTLAGRAIAYTAAGTIDRSHRAPDDATRQLAASRAALLTPIVKAFSGEVGFEVASLNVQVHGGMGFVEETGAAQYLRTHALSRSTRAPTAFRRSISSCARSSGTMAPRRKLKLASSVAV
ncbi:MAG: hypothetical protein JOZ17_21375 [Acetobacteraceae bacterium]|nr:hypothetical protein [Acetobacteraceae bacterium]